MVATIHTLQRTQSFPDRIEGCLQAQDWVQLQREIEEGFDPTITAYGGMSLFECILHRADQDGYVPPLALPKPLLDTLLAKGVGQTLPCGKPLVVTCVEYGQWEWAHQLLDSGFLVQNEDFPVLDAMALGRAQRCQDVIMAKIRPGLASTEGATDAERAAERTQKFSMAMMEYSKVIYAKDLRSISRMTQRLVDEFGVNPNAPLKQAPAREALDIPGIRNIPSALDNAILRQDESMAFALMGAGARSDGAVVIDQSNLGSVVCRPVDLAISARCYDLFIHILQSNPDSKHPQPGTRYPGDPASFPLVSVMVSNLIPLENAAAILDELLRSSHDQWTAQELGSAMHVAAKAGHVGMMKSLFAHGVAYDVPTYNGFLPIHQACDGASQEAIDFLMSKGSRLSDASHTGIKAMDFLQASSPELAAHYCDPQPASNVVMLRPRNRP